MLLLNETLHATPPKTLRVLELGSGCGIVGITLAQAVPNCHVLLTDMPEAADIAQRNIAEAVPATRSLHSQVSFEVLDWEKPLPQSVQSKLLDIILVSECIYNPDSIPALVRTLAALLNRSPKAIIVVSTKVRHSSEAVFFDLMAKTRLVIGEHTSLPLPGDGGWNVDEPEQVGVYIFHHRDRQVVAAAPNSRDRCA